MNTHDILPVLIEARNALKCARHQLAGSKPLSGVHASSLRCDLMIVDQAIKHTEGAVLALQKEFDEKP